MSIKLSNGAVITSDCELKVIKRFEKFEITIEYNGNVIETVIRPDEIDNACSPYNKAKDSKGLAPRYEFLDMSVSRADLLLIKDYLLKREIRFFSSYDELNEFEASEESENEFFGEVFDSFSMLEILVEFPRGKRGIFPGAVYKYQKPYKDSLVFKILDEKEQRKKIKEGRKKEARNKKVKVAISQNTMLGLPKLTGSTKQKQWAEQIRAEYFNATPEDKINPETLTATTSRFWIDKYKDVLREQ